jgi:hypothetical protein
VKVASDARSLPKGLTCTPAARQPAHMHGGCNDKRIMISVFSWSHSIAFPRTYRWFVAGAVTHVRSRRGHVNARLVAPSLGSPRTGRCQVRVLNHEAPPPAARCRRGRQADRNAQVSCRAGGEVCDSHPSIGHANMLIRAANQLRRESDGRFSSGRYLHRPHSQGREGRRLAHNATDEIRDGCQSQDR